MAQVTSPTQFSFDHNGVDVVSFHFQIVDDASGDVLVGSGAVLPDPSLHQVGQTYSGQLADFSMGAQQVGYDIPVRLTVQAFDADGHGSSVASSPAFSFTLTMVPDAPSNVTVF